MIGRPDAREEEVTGYDTLVGTPIPKNDWPPKLIFVRSPLMEAMTEQMFIADLKSWSAYFTEKHGELAGKTTEELEKDMQTYMKELGALLKSEGLARPTDDAKKDANISHSDDDKHKLEVDVPPKVPPIKLPAVPAAAQGIERVATPRSARPGSPRNLRKDPLIPLLAGHAKEEREKNLGKFGLPKQRHPLYTGVSKTQVIKSVPDPADVTFGDEGDEHQVSESEDVYVPPEAQPMQKLQWQSHAKGISIAQEGSVFYLSRDPSKHANPIEAFSVPGVGNSTRLHISNRKFPSLAVNNMLQMDLYDNRNWNTLATDDEFALFFQQHLHNPAQPEPMRLAEMRVQDLATFTQQMALEYPEAHWYPMTTTTVRYMPNADPPIRSDKAPPPALRAGQSFGVSYDGLDFLGNSVQSSVLLSFDQGTGFYSIIAPTSKEPIPTKAREPMDALQEFMEMLGAAHRNLPNTTFTLLYHVPPNHHGGENEEIRQMVNDEKGNTENLAWAWIAHSDHADKALGDIERACQMLEEENSYLLWEAYFEGKSREDIAASVMANRTAIEHLRGAYSHLVAMLDPLSI
jgi:hypothetical protein